MSGRDEASVKPTPLIEVAFGTLDRTGIAFSVRVSDRVDADGLRDLAKLIQGAADKIDADPSLIDQWQAV